MSLSEKRWHGSMPMGRKARYILHECHAVGCSLFGILHEGWSSNEQLGKV